MKTRHLLVVVAGIVGAAFAVGQISAQDADRGERPQPADQSDVPAQPDREQERRPAAKADQLSPEEAEQAQRQAGIPGEAHARFDVLAGRWDAEITAWFMGEDEPVRSTGVTRYEWVLRDPDATRGRFLRQEFRGELMGRPFSGLGYWGHDNIQEHYTSLWMDSMSTVTTMSRGVYNEDERAFTFSGSYTIAEGQEMKVRMVLTIVDDGRHTFEYFQSQRGMPERKGMEIVYTRSRPGGEDRDRRRNGDRQPARPDAAPEEGGQPRQ